MQSSWPAKPDEVSRVTHRITIHHSTRYFYHRPVRLNRHRLVIRPREGHDVRIDEMTLRIQPANTITWVRDVFGNSIAWVDFEGPTESLHIDNEVTVVRSAPFPDRTLHQPGRVPYPVTYDALEQPVVAAYLNPSFPDETPVLQRWLGTDFNIDTGDTEGTALALTALIHERVQYQRRHEKGVQTPSKTLSLSTGSCRDMATLLMDAARVLGIAARFASGYLHGSASLAGRASTHAWAEIYLPSLGWRGFDPTLGTATNEKHIVTGVSNHPRGVMPISGTYAGAPADFNHMEVQVRTMEVGSSVS